MTDKIGYHLCNIIPGVLGEASKIQEELDELKDALAQGCKIMELVELADLYGALECYLENKRHATCMADLAAFSSLCGSASRVLGETKKIQEELDALKETQEQAGTVIGLVKLANLYGEIECYLATNHPTITMSDLAVFSSITKRAFLNGARQSK